MIINKNNVQNVNAEPYYYLLLIITTVIFFLTVVSVELPDTGFSPQATRRISSSSLLKEVVSLAASTAGLGGSSVSLRSGRERSKSMEKTEKKLPIINPLVRLPMWPSKTKVQY